MEHLNIETLARLVDEPAQPSEADHLAGCEACASELAVLMEQTGSLGMLPDILPPRGDWEVLAARLRSDGLVCDPGLFRRLGHWRTPAWMPAAAAIVLFLGGTAFGTSLDDMAGAEIRGVEQAAERPAVAMSTVEDAASAVRVAEEQYVTAVSRYRELMEQQGGSEPASDPVSRYAALQHLVSVSQAAVRQAPGDPFLNGFLASALAERDVAARQVSSVSPDNWF
jgi:hypothetical protein